MKTLNNNALTFFLEPLCDSFMFTLATNNLVLTCTNDAPGKNRRTARLT
jgi:hypothetical protein